MTVTTVGTFTVTGTFRQYNGAPAHGYVLIHGNPGWARTSTGGVIILGPRLILLDALGRFAARLPTDSNTGDSTALTYSISVHIHGADTFAQTFPAQGLNTLIDASTPGVVTPLPATGTLPTAIPFTLGDGAPTDPNTGTSGSNIPQTIPFTLGGSGNPSVLRLALDTDGTYYAAPNGAYALLIDTDGTPYVSTDGTPGGSINTDTDGTPYYVA